MRPRWNDRYRTTPDAIIWNYQVQILKKKQKFNIFNKTKDKTEDFLQKLKLWKSIDIPVPKSKIIKLGIQQQIKIGI